MTWTGYSDLVMSSDHKEDRRKGAADEKESAIDRTYGKT